MSNIINHKFLTRKLLPSLSLLLIPVVYWLTLAPDVLMGDGGRFQILAAMGGIAHPPGYGLYSGAVYAFNHLCWAEPAFCANLFSTLAAVATLTLLLLLLRCLNIIHGIRVFILFTLAFSALFWLLSIRAEVYTFYLFFLAAALYSSLSAFKSFSAAAAVAALFCWGVVVSGRPVFLPVVVVFIMMLWTQRQRLHSRLVFLLGGILFLLPFVLKIAYLGLADWYKFGYNYIDQYNAEFGRLPDADGVQALLQRLSWLVSGAQFRSRIYFDVNNIIQAVEALARLLFKANFTLPALLLVFPGAWCLFKKQKRFFLLLMLVAAVNLLYFSMTHAGDRITFLLPFLLVLAILIAAGLQRLYEWKGKVVLLFALVPLFLLLHNYTHVDRSQLTLYRHFVIDFCKRAPAHASVFCSWSVSTALLYARMVESCRTDVRIIPMHAVKIEEYMQRYDFQAPFFHLQVDKTLNSTFVRLDCHTSKGK